jgi:acetyl-CoA synthetase
MTSPTPQDATAEAMIAPPVDPETWCTPAQYGELYAASLRDPDGFWALQADRIDWSAKPTRINRSSFDPVDIRWYEDGELNLCFNCVDRHVFAGAW